MYVVTLFMCMYLCCPYIFLFIEKLVINVNYLCT